MRHAVKLAAAVLVYLHIITALDSLKGEIISGDGKSYVQLSLQNITAKYFTSSAMMDDHHWYYPVLWIIQVFKNQQYIWNLYIKPIYHCQRNPRTYEVSAWYRLLDRSYCMRLERTVPHPGCAYRDMTSRHRQLRLLVRRPTVWQCSLLFLALYLTCLAILILWISHAHTQVLPAHGPIYGAFKPKKPPSEGNTLCFGTNQNIQEPNFISLDDLHILSAYYDDRNPDDNHIKVLVITRVIKPPEIYCFVRGSSHKLHIIEASFKRLDHANTKYGAFLMLCPLPEELQSNPCKVYISNDTALETHLAPVPLQFLSPTAQISEVAVCVPPLHGVIPQHKLVEFIELQTLLGAHHFFFYDYRGSRHEKYRNMNVDQVLEYYRSASHVSLYKWQLPVLEEHIGEVGHSLALHHCLYSNMALYQYLTFLNLHEFIVPAKLPGIWTDILTTHINSQHAGLCFKGAFFNPVIGEPLVSMASLKRTKLYDSSDIFVARCIINAYKIDTISDYLIPKAVRSTVLKGMEQEQGVVHIYDNCEKAHQPQCELVEDKSMLKLQQSLRMQFVLAMEKIAQLEITWGGHDTFSTSIFRTLFPGTGIFIIKMT